jgi:hypothetical protein
MSGSGLPVVVLAAAVLEAEQLGNGYLRTGNLEEKSCVCHRPADVRLDALELMAAANSGADEVLLR